MIPRSGSASQSSIMVPEHLVMMMKRDILKILRPVPVLMRVYLNQLTCSTTERFSARKTRRRSDQDLLADQDREHRDDAAQGQAPVSPMKTCAGMNCTRGTRCRPRPALHVDGEFAGIRIYMMLR